MTAAGNAPVPGLPAEPSDWTAPRWGQNKRPVIASFGTNAIIEDSDGNPHRCVPRQNMDTTVCGDRVIWQSSGTEEGVVVALEPRRTLLTRQATTAIPARSSPIWTRWY